MAKKKLAALSAMQYWQKHGATHCAQMAARAGTTYEYWKHICNLRKRPRPDLAMRLVSASTGELTLESLLAPSVPTRTTGAPPMADGNPRGARLRGVEA